MSTNKVFVEFLSENLRYSKVKNLNLLTLKLSIEDTLKPLQITLTANISQLVKVSMLYDLDCAH